MRMRFAIIVPPPSTPLCRRLLCLSLLCERGKKGRGEEEGERDKKEGGRVT